MTSVMPDASRHVSSPLTDADPSEHPGGLGRISSLDGIRAFAVMAVLLYHGGISWMGGGLLGVDVFFVLSGFLITSLLCRELSRSSTVRLARFWARRARRLLPALFVLLLGVAAYAYFFSASIDLASVRNDALSTLFYVANWHFIFSNQGYFAQAAAPSPFLHTWSLAVEEQYYLIWPLIVLFVFRRWGISKVAVTAAVGAVASTVLMLALYLDGFSIDRLYYGTDTRAQALLVGSFLGAIGSHIGDHFVILPAGWTAGRLGRAGWVLTGAVGGLFLVWAWHTLAGPDPLLYHGGFLLVSLATGAVVITCVTFPASLLTRLLSLRALVFTGRISYGLYLYHWPLFLAIDHARTGLSGVGLLATRLAATFAVATVSFFAVEEPIRTGRFLRGRKGLVGTGVAAVITASAVLLATVAPATTSFAVPAATAIPGAERRALDATGAFTTNPVRFLLVGDSVALTLGVGLNVQSVHRYGVRILDGVTLGCDLDNLKASVSGVVAYPVSDCTRWRTLWPLLVATDHPEVVGLLIGRWVITDHFEGGRVVHVGQPAWDAHLTAELNQAIDIFSANGAKVALFTMPDINPPQEAPNGMPYPENNPARVDEFNRILTSVAAARRSSVTLIDLHGLVDPNGSYQAVIDGVRIRDTDGIHFVKAAGEWLQPVIFPTIARLGLSAGGR